MSANRYTATKGLDENLKLFVSSKRDPAMYNLHIALKAIVAQISDVQTAVDQLSKRVR